MNKKGHVPIRTCIGCREKRKKEEMIWFKQSSNGRVAINKEKNLKGRGFYLCPDLICLKKAQKRNKVGAALVIGGVVESHVTNIFHWIKGLA